MLDSWTIDPKTRGTGINLPSSQLRLPLGGAVIVRRFFGTQRYRKFKRIWGMFYAYDQVGRCIEQLREATLLTGVNLP